MPDTRTRLPGRRRGAAASAGAAGTVGRSVIVASSPGRSQEVKIDFFWLSMLLVRPSMSSGFLMKVWRPGSITVEAKSGRVSRSRNWAIDSAEPTNSTAFFCSPV